jgi:transposase
VTARHAFVAGQPELDSARLVFLDESGVDVGMGRSYGWSPVGTTPEIERPAHGKRFTLIGAIAANGARALRKVEGYVDGDEFVRFLRDDLGPALSPGDVVVMDGPRLHRVKGVAEVLAERGATALYLPAYSPELNPIEMTWAWIKKLLRDAPQRKLAGLKTRVDELWARLSDSLCAGWIRHSGYTST